MRITGGSAKGHTLKTLSGLNVRPTTDKVREAIFSMLTLLSKNWSRGLDLFAGSGALGIEALSRQAEWVDFVDQNNRCCLIIKQNLLRTGFISKSHVYCCSASKAISFLSAPYDFIFMDPPYADNTLSSTINSIGKSRLISENSVVLVSHATRSGLSEQYANLTKIKEKQYGDTCISIYQKEAIS